MIPKDLLDYLEARGWSVSVLADYTYLDPKGEGNGLWDRRFLPLLDIPTEDIPLHLAAPDILYESYLKPFLGILMDYRLSLGHLGHLGHLEEQCHT